jgi:hypothetical protein
MCLIETYRGGTRCYIPGDEDYVLLIGAVCLVIAIRDGGPYSVDRLIGKEL